jgi:uncharacterized membrane protein YtjA (UPF0391 family)
VPPSPLATKPKNRNPAPETAITDSAGISSTASAAFGKEKNVNMLKLAVVFLVIALIAAVFGFGVVAHYSWAGAQILFVVFLILAVLSFLGHAFRRRSFWR